MTTRSAPRLPARRDDETTSFGAWTLVWVLYGAKVATVVLVVWAEQSYQSAVFVTITTWFWLGPLLALGAAPLLFRVRLRRIRARRAALIVSEWHVASPMAQDGRAPLPEVSVSEPRREP